MADTLIVSHRRDTLIGAVPEGRQVGAGRTFDRTWDAASYGCAIERHRAPSRLRQALLGFSRAGILVLGFALGFLVHTLL